MPTRIQPGRPGAVAPASLDSSRPAGPLAGPLLTPRLPRRSDAFDAPRPQADGSLTLGRRENGPGQVSMNKTGELLLDGKRSVAANIEVARLIESGVSPFKHATDAQRAALTSSLIASLETPKPGKPMTSALLGRSAAATLLLSLAGTSDGKVRDQALNAYVVAMGQETHHPLKTSMLINLDASKLPLKKTVATIADQVRAQVMPAQPPYEGWFKGAHPRLEVKHYVMDEFWKSELSAYKHRGFEVTSESPKEVVFEKVLKDPSGKNPDVTAHVVVKQTEKDIFRDLDDPKVNMVIYSGHSQYGGIADSSVRSGPSQMKGDKLVAMFNCRGKQNVGAFKEKYPDAHLSATFSSAYSEDDIQMLSQTYEMIARRGGYSDVRAGLKNSALIGGKANYMLPDDARQLAYHDNDLDGLHDGSPVGADKFFDPSRRRAAGGSNVFRPATIAEDPQTLSGAKVDHAVGYANTAFYYFSEENRAAPITNAKADRLEGAGWFSSTKDEPVRITESTRGGQTFYSVAVNSKYADKSREVITSMVLYEVQKHLSLKEGHFDQADKLRGLVLVAQYLDMYMEYGDQIDEVLSGFSRKYGFDGVSYGLMFEAMKKDGHDGTATRAALDYLTGHGVSVTA